MTNDEPGFDPICARPNDIRWPLKVGRRPDGPSSPTWRVANGPSFKRVARGIYVPADRPGHVEQRIVEAAARLPPDASRGCVSGWAALRWRGAAYFDGRGVAGRDDLPVELVVGGTRAHLTSTPQVRVLRRDLHRVERDAVAGLPITTVQRALFDEIRRRGDLWSAVQAIDMTAAAGLISVWLFAQYVSDCNSVNGAPLARHAVSLAVDESRSPRESWLRLVWRLVAGLPEPLINVPVYDLHGRLIGVPDIFDAEAGVVAEYDGGVHRSEDRRRRDVQRETRFRDHGLEYLCVVQGEDRYVAADRIERTRARALRLAARPAAWTLVPPPWVAPVETLDEQLERRGLVHELTKAWCDSVSVTHEPIVRHRVNLPGYEAC